jgi:ABC-type transporter Mla subunit MlaD
MARLPGIDGVLGAIGAVLQAQTEALAALPGAVTALSSTVKGLAETVQRMNDMTARLDSIVTELEEPLKALAPGMQRMAAVLDDPIVEEIPKTLKQMQDDILPVLRTLADTNERVAFIAGSTERIMTFVDDTSRTLAGLPGAALLGRRKPGPKVVLPSEPIAPPPPID